MAMSSFQGFHQVTNFANAEKVLTLCHIYSPCKLYRLSNVSKSAILSALTQTAHIEKKSKALLDLQFQTNVGPYLCPVFLSLQ